jgi:hypothetical protein
LRINALLKRTGTTDKKEEAKQTAFNIGNTRLILLRK